MQNVQVIGYTPYGYELLTVGAIGVTRLSQNLRGDARLKGIILTVETNDIHYRIDGGDPTNVNGHLILTNNEKIFNNPASIRNLRMIAIGGAATVAVTYLM